MLHIIVPLTTEDITVTLLVDTETLTHIFMPLAFVLRTILPSALSFTVTQAVLISLTFVFASIDLAQCLFASHPHLFGDNRIVLVERHDRHTLRTDLL